MSKLLLLIAKDHTYEVTYVAEATGVSVLLPK